MPHQSWCLNDSEVDQQNNRTQPQDMKVCLQNIGVHILNIRNHQTNIKLAMLNIKTQQVNTLIHHINMKVQLQNIRVDPTKMKIYHANIKVHIVKMYPPVLWPIILLMALHTFFNSSSLFKVISRFMGWLENRLSEFHKITADCFVIADLAKVVNWYLSACVGFWDIRGGFGGQN